MKIVETYDIINPDLFTKNKILQEAWQQVESAVLATDWPHGSGSFTIYPESGKKSKQGNGVKPIKVPCMRFLQKFGWQVEKLPNVGSSVLKTGDLDALKRVENQFILFEWETGNISSSHRALNKLFLTMQETPTIGAFLVVPSDNLKVYLTDRIGNIGELRPYFKLWQNIPNIKGAMRIVVAEHDHTSFDVPKIPKGKDGMAPK
ncbi:MAG: hypothetical protein NXI20_20500 [bacterium]|nr:hypothetical protein [bacterium]